MRLAEADSTNQVAAELADQGAPEGSTVLAEVQTAGSGRLGRRWASPRGGLWLTVILRPPAERLDAWPTLTMVGGVAVAETVADLLAGEVGEGLEGSLDVRIKWPNDVLLNRRKVAGLLGQARLGGPGVEPAVLLGVGLNLNVDRASLPPEIRDTATSLSAATGHRFDADAALESLTERLDRWYGTWLREGFGPARGRCLALSATVGRSVQAIGPKTAITGEALDILGDGALLIRSADGRETTVRAADVSLRSG